MSCQVKPSGLVITIALLSLLAVLLNPRTTMSQGKPDRQIIPGVILVLDPSGFSPSSVSLPKGRLLLGIDNRTGFEDLVFHLDRISGNRIKEVKPRKGRHDYREVYDLSPGNYVLSEASHPQWICHITITPH